MAWVEKYVNWNEDAVFHTNPENLTYDESIQSNCKCYCDEWSRIGLRIV